MSTKKRRVTKKQQENEPSELNNKPSTSGTSTAPFTPATTTTNTNLTAIITKAIAEALKVAGIGQTSQCGESDSVQDERAMEDEGSSTQNTVNIMPRKRKSTRTAARGAKRRRVTEELQENEPSELNNEPSTSGISTAPSRPATPSVAEALKAVAEAFKAVAEALKAAEVQASTIRSSKEITEFQKNTPPDEQQEIAPSELNNEPSTSGTSTAPFTPATTTTNTNLTAIIIKAVAEALKVVGIGQTSQCGENDSVRDERAKEDEVIYKPDVTTPITLGNLFKQDLKTANIFSYYPNSYVQNYFVYDANYFTVRSNPEENNPYLLLYPGQICSIAGDELPILMDEQPSANLMAHWKKWLPQFPEPKFKTVDEGIDEDEDPIVTIFPMKRIPKEKHAVDPDMHCHVLRKSAIPKTKAKCPKHFTQKNAEFPCMVKVDQSLGGYGNYVAYNKKELKEKLEIIKDRFGQGTPFVITRFVQNVEETLGCQFYLNKKGEVHWLGTNVNLLKDFVWVGNIVDWDLREDHRERVYDSFVLPVADYLHKKGYFGIAGIDVITSPSGDYLVDMNARITGFTPHALIAREMAREGLTKSHFKSADYHKCSTEELIKKANYANETTDGKILILYSMDVDEGCLAAIVAFGQTMAEVEDLFDCLTDEK